MPLKPKPLSKKVTARFLMEMDRVVGRQLTAKAFAKTVGMTASNINRLRKPGNTCVTVEAICLLVKKYKTDSNWLLTGKTSLPNSLNSIFSPP